MPVNPYVILSELTAVNVSALSKFAQVKDFKMSLFKRERRIRREHWHYPFKQHYIVPTFERC